MPWLDHMTIQSAESGLRCMRATDQEDLRRIHPNLILEQVIQLKPNLGSLDLKKAASCISEHYNRQNSCLVDKSSVSENVQEEPQGFHQIEFSKCLIASSKVSKSQNRTICKQEGAELCQAQPAKH